MSATPTVEVFSAGCELCDEAVEMVKRLACPSCKVSVLDMKDPVVVERAKTLGVCSVPAVAINGKIADCCAGQGRDEATLRAAGLGTPLM